MPTSLLGQPNRNPLGGLAGLGLPAQPATPGTPAIDPRLQAILDQAQAMHGAGQTIEWPREESIDDLRAQAMAEMGGGSSYGWNFGGQAGRLAPQQPMLPSPPAGPGNLALMQDSPTDLLSALMSGGPATYPFPIGPPTQDVAAMHDAAEARMNRPSPAGQYIDAMRQSNAQGLPGMTMGQYGELPPDAQAMTKSWSSGFGERVNPMEELIAKHGAAITSTGQTVPAGRNYPGVRAMPMGLGQDGHMSSGGQFLAGAPRSPEDIAQGRSIAEQNLIAKGFVKTPMGWAGPKTIDKYGGDPNNMQQPSALAGTTSRAQPLQQAEYQPSPENADKWQAFRGRMREDAMNQIEAVRQGRERAPELLQERGQRLAEARRLRMSGMDPRMAELVAGGGQGGPGGGQGNLLSQALLMGPQAAAAIQQGDADRGMRMQAMDAEMMMRQQQMQQQAEQHAAEMAMREKGIDVQREVGLAGSKGPQGVIDLANSQDPTTRTIARQQLGMTNEMGAQADLAAGNFDTPAVTQYIGQIYDSKDWDDTGLFGGSSFEWSVSHDELENAFVRNVHAKTGVPQDALRRYYRRRHGLE